MASFDEVIPPGQVGHIEAKLDTAKLSGSVGRGITVYTDDPARPKFLLTVRAMVVGGVEILPQQMISVTNLSSGGNAPAVLVRPTSSENHPVEVGELTASMPWIVATAERLDASRPAADGLPSGRPGDWLVSVAIDPSAPHGRFRETLTVQTGLERQPEVTIPILVTRMAPVQVSAESISFPVDSDPHRQPQIVLLTVRRDLDPTALKVEATPDDLTAELVPSGRRGYKVQVRWTGADRPHGSLTFRVGQESVELPVVEPADPS